MTHSQIHPVYGMNAEQRQMAADWRPVDQADGLQPLARLSRRQWNYIHLFTQPKIWYSHFTIPQREEGWVEL